MLEWPRRVRHAGVPFRTQARMLSMLRGWIWLCVARASHPMRAWEPPSAPLRVDIHAGVACSRRLGRDPAAPARFIQNPPAPPARRGWFV